MSASNALSQAKLQVELFEKEEELKVLQATGDEVFDIVKGYYNNRGLSPKTIAFDFTADTVIFNAGSAPTVKTKTPKAKTSGGTGRKRIQWSQKEVTNGFETLPVKAAIDKYLDEETKTYVIGFYIRAIPALKEATGQDWKFVGPDQPA